MHQCAIRITKILIVHDLEVQASQAVGSYEVQQQGSDHLADLALQKSAAYWAGKACWAEETADYRAGSRPDQVLQQVGTVASCQAGSPAGSLEAAVEI